MSTKKKSSAAKFNEDDARDTATRLRLPVGVVAEIHALAARAGKSLDAICKEIAAEVAPKAEETPSRASHEAVWSSRVTQGAAVKELRARLAK